MLGILSWGHRMPASFPLETPQNSGNMVHAMAPFTMFPNSVGVDYGFKNDGYGSFADFVNERCDALIIPYANTISTDPTKDAKGLSLCKSLDQFRVPIIAFGLGAQAPTTNMEEFELGPGMRQFVQYLSEHALTISVRGEFTYKIFEKYGSVERVFNTGCPSFYSRPEAFDQLRKAVTVGSFPSNITFSGSLYHLPGPKQRLFQAIQEGAYIVEPVNRFLHQFYLDCVNNIEDLEPAYFLKSLLDFPEWNIAELREYMLVKYRLFRDLNSWTAFNRECIDGTIGSRFHVNMASLISGVPATWLVHDSRTQELCERLSLPFIHEATLVNTPYRELIAQADFRPMFEHLESNFHYFNEFLAQSGLPLVNIPTASTLDDSSALDPGMS